MDVLLENYETAVSRRETRADGSYTCYLFDQGLDKILKKCAEECGEVIIAAKNGDPGELTAEISDLLYHVAVLMAEQNISYDDLRREHEKRSRKTGNLKNINTADKNT